ncbi:RagB/SusD family nutrient uptake outer membrane protein [Chryseobacterium indoltheticum]
MIRYADVLLMYAEVLNSQGNTAGAVPCINRIRQRPGLFCYFYFYFCK